MDKNSMKVLSLLNKHSLLNWYQFDVLIPSLSLEKFAEVVGYLQREKYIKQYNPSCEKNNADCSFTHNTRFEITLAGVQFLESENLQNRKFKIQSVYVPILIAFATSLVTTLTTIWLSK